MDRPFRLWAWWTHVESGIYQWKIWFDSLQQQQLLLPTVCCTIIALQLTQDTIWRDDAPNDGSGADQHAAIYHGRDPKTCPKGCATGFRKRWKGWKMKTIMKAENVWKHMAWKMSGLMYVSAIFSTSSCSACTRSADKHSHSANQICYTTTLCHSFQKDVMLFHYLSKKKYGDLVAVLFVFSDNWQLPSLKIVLCKWASLQSNLQGIRCDPSFNIILKVCFARIRSMYYIVCRMLIIPSVDL